MTTFAMLRHRVVPGLLLLEALAGCSAGGVPSAVGVSAPATVQSAVQPAVLQPVNRGAEIMTAFRLALDQYWRGRLPQVTPTVAFTAPSEWFAYTDADAGNQRGGCNLLAQNAIYCNAPRSILYSTDWLTMLDQKFSRTANMATVVVLAHEYGHHISRLHGRPFVLQMARELQADCYAGAFVRGISVGGYPLRLENGDIEDARTTLGGIADASFVWSDPKAHGAKPERMAAFSRGYMADDPSYCEAYEKTGPIQVRTFGTVQYRMPAAATVTELDGGAVRFSTQTESEFTTDVTVLPASLSAEPAQALSDYQSSYFAGSQTRLLAAPAALSWQPGGFSLAVVDYEQQHPSLGVLHGKLILASRPDGSRVLFDCYARGAAPTGADGWASLVAFADVIMAGLN